MKLCCGQRLRWEGTLRDSNSRSRLVGVYPSGTLLGLDGLGQGAGERRTAAFADTRPSSP